MLKGLLLFMLLAIVASCQPVVTGELGVDQYQPPKTDATSAESSSLPYVNFSSSAGKISEDAGTYTIFILLSQASDKTITVPFEILASSTALLGSDYSTPSPNGSVVFAPGQVSAQVDITILDDAINEGSERISLKLSSLADGGYALGQLQNSEVEILDNESIPVITFDTATDSSVENDPLVQTFTVTVNLSTASANDLIVPYYLSGEATLGPDYVLDIGSSSLGSMTIPAGSTSFTKMFTIVDDTYNEQTERIIMTLLQSDKYILGTSNIFTYTIYDNEGAPTVQIDNVLSTVGPVLENAGVPLDVVITLTGSVNEDIYVPYSVTGSATVGADHTLTTGTVKFPAGSTSQTLEIDLINDLRYEGDETIQVSLGIPDKADLGATTSHTITIQEDDPAPAITFDLGSSSVTEPDNSTGAGLVNVRLRVKIQNNQTSDVPITVPYSVNLASTAALNEDHTLFDDGAGSYQEQFIIPAGQVYGELNFKIRHDLWDEDDETVVVDLGGAITNGTLCVGGPPCYPTHTVTIVDNDAPPTLSFDKINQKVAEGSPGGATVRVKLDKKSGKNVTACVQTIGGSATEGTDYTLPAGWVSGNPNTWTISIPAGSLSADVNLGIATDAEIDSETIVLTLGACNTPPQPVMNATVVNPISHTISIVDAVKLPMVEFNVEQATVAENAGSFAVTVNLTEQTNYPVIVPITISDIDYDDNRAEHEEGKDYQIPTTWTAEDKNTWEITIPAGATTASKTFLINDDYLYEDDEIANFEMGNVTNAIKPTHETAPARAEWGGVVFKAVKPGKTGEAITLNFDGIQDIDAIVSAWNTANPTNTVTHDGVGTTILATQTVTLKHGFRGTHELTIQDDETVPRIQFKVVNNTVQEDAGSIFVIAELVGTPPFDGTGREVSIPVAIDPFSTLVLGLDEDYELPVNWLADTFPVADDSWRIVIPAGEKEGKVEFKLRDDFDHEDPITPEDLIVYFDDQVETGSGRYVLYGVAGANYPTYASGSTPFTSTCTGEPGPATGGGIPFPAENEADCLNAGINGGAGVWNAVPQHTTQVFDNDGPPKLSFDVINSEVHEGIGQAEILVRLSGRSYQDINVPYQLSVNQTANDRTNFPAEWDFDDTNLSADFGLYGIDNPLSSPIVIPAGAKDFKIIVPIQDDSISEAQETAIFQLLAPPPSEAVLNSGLDEHTLKINDNEKLPQVQFNASLIAVTEGTDPDFTIQVDLVDPTNTSSATIVVPVQSITGSAQLGVDFDVPAGWDANDPSTWVIEILPGNTFGQVTFPVIDEFVYEPIENSVFILGTPQGATLGNIVYSTVSIDDDDVAPEVNFASTDQVVMEENKNIEVVVELSSESGYNTQVPYRVIPAGDGNAFANWDGITFTADTPGAAGNGIVLVFDNRAAVTYDGIDFSADNEGTGGEAISLNFQEYATGTITGAIATGVTFTAVNPGLFMNGEIIDNTYIDGVNDLDTIVSDWNTANPGYEITHNGTGALVPLPENVTLGGVVDVDTVVDAWNLANPTNTVSHNGLGTDVLATGTANLGILTVDDVVNAWNVANPGNTVSHNGVGTEKLASRTVFLTGGVLVDATNGIDYSFTEGFLNITPGQSSGTLTINMKDDLDYEGYEYIAIELYPTGLQNAVLGLNDTHIIRINDNDSPPKASFEVNYSEVTESTISDQYIDLKVVLDSVSFKDTWVNIGLNSLSGTATADAGDGICDPGFCTGGLGGETTQYECQQNGGDWTPGDDFLWPATWDVAGADQTTVGFLLPAGVTEAVETITVCPDSNFEIDETITLVVGSIVEYDMGGGVPTNIPAGLIGANPIHNVYIKDGGITPKVSFDMPTQVVEEDAPGYARVEISLNVLSDYDVVVPFSSIGGYGGDQAKYPDDFTYPTGWSPSSTSNHYIIIPAGSLVPDQDLFFPIVADNLVEKTEAFQLTMADPYIKKQDDGYVGRGDVSQHIVYINTDLTDETPDVYFASRFQYVNEAQGAAQPMLILTAPSAYDVEVAYRVHSDACYYVDPNVTANGQYENVQISQSLAQVCDDGTYEKAENNGGDFDWYDGIITIPAGQTLVQLPPIPIVNDPHYERDEHFTLEIISASNADFYTGASSQVAIDNFVTTITIVNDDPLPEINFDVTSYQVDQVDPTITRQEVFELPGSGTEVKIKVTASGTNIVPMSVPINILGSASPAEAPVCPASAVLLNDYTLPGHNDCDGFGGYDTTNWNDPFNRIITIPPGETEAEFSIFIQDDFFFEAPETIVFSLMNPTNALSGAMDTHIITISDTDPLPTPSFTTINQVVYEPKLCTNQNTNWDELGAAWVGTIGTAEGIGIDCSVAADVTKIDTLKLTGLSAVDVTVKIDIVPEDVVIVPVASILGDAVISGDYLLPADWSEFVNPAAPNGLWYFEIDPNQPGVCDYLPGTVQSNYGQCTKTVTFLIMDDNVYEADDTFTISMGVPTLYDAQTFTNYNLQQGAITNTTVTILNDTIGLQTYDRSYVNEVNFGVAELAVPNDPPPTVKFTKAEQQILEIDAADGSPCALKNGKQASFDVELSELSAFDTTVFFKLNTYDANLRDKPGTGDNLSYKSTAKAGIDHDLQTGFFMIPKGTLGNYATFCVLDDIQTEGDEWIAVELQNPLNGQKSTVPTEYRHLISIKHNDPMKVFAGAYNTCAIVSDQLKCWGRNNYSQTGYPSSLGTTLNEPQYNFVDLGTDPNTGGPVVVKKVGIGSDHICAMYEILDPVSTFNEIKCWGRNYYGQLGIGKDLYGDIVGDNPAEMGDGLPNVPFGCYNPSSPLSNAPGDTSCSNPANSPDTPVDLAVGWLHTCAALTSGKVRCWGRNQYGQLGMNLSMDSGLFAGDVVNFPNAQIAFQASQVSAGFYHTCASDSLGSNVQCWGYNTQGALGEQQNPYGTTWGLSYSNANIGDDPGEIAIQGKKISDYFGVTHGMPVERLISGNSYSSCAYHFDTFSTQVTCWGENSDGQLGRPHKNDIGRSSAPYTYATEYGTPNQPTIRFVDASSSNTALMMRRFAMGDRHTCALLFDGRVSCVGDNASGQLGRNQATTYDYGGTAGSGGQNYYNTASSPKAPVSTIEIGEATDIAAGRYHTCVVKKSNELSCWGENGYGQLGLGPAGGTIDIGTDTNPVSNGATLQFTPEAGYVNYISN